MEPFLHCSHNLDLRMVYPQAIPSLGYNMIFIDPMKVIAFYLS